MFNNFKRNTAMSIYTPYFYVIQDSRNGTYYAGARWRKECNPSELLQKNGYLTSSKKVKDIITESGEGIFIIRKIKTFTTADEAYDYETRFLEKVDAKNNEKFYNGHNNNRPAPYGTQEFADLMMAKHGVTHAIYSTVSDAKRKETNIKRYGVDHYSKTDEYKVKYNSTSRNKYGVDHPLQSPKIREKGKKTNLERYGVEHAIQNKSIREKGSKTNLERNGSEKYNNRDLARETSVKNYGFDHYTKTPENRATLSKRAIEREQNYRNRPNVILLKKYIEKYGRENIGCGNAWWRKPDPYLKTLIENAVLNYGEL